MMFKALAFYSFGLAFAIAAWTFLALVIGFATQWDIALRVALGLGVGASALTLLGVIFCVIAWWDSHSGQGDEQWRRLR